MAGNPDLITLSHHLSSSTSSMGTLVQYDEAVESFQIWMKLFPKLKFDLKYIIEGMKETLSEIPTAETDEMDQESKCMAHTYAMELAAITFLCHLLNNSEDAKNYLDRTLQFLSKCFKDDYIPTKYTESFNYMLNPIKSALMNGQDDQEDQWHGKIPNICDLFKESQAGIWGMKQHFFEVLRSDFDQQATFLEEAIALDPGYHLWRLRLHKVLRGKRLKSQYHHNRTYIAPWKREEIAIATANRLNPLNPWCRVEGLLMLADHVKDDVVRKRKNLQSRWIPVQNNDFYFDSRQKVVKFIKDEAEKLIREFPDSVHCNTTISYIFRTYLPYRDRDFDVSERCLRRCLESHPTRLLANYGLADNFLKLGERYLKQFLAEKVPEMAQYSEKAKKNLEMAIEYWEKARKYFETAYHASMTFGGKFSYVICYVQILMAKPNENFFLLSNIFEEHLENPFFDDREKRSLKFMKSLFLFALSMAKEAIDLCCEIYKEEARSLDFGGIQYQFNRFGWWIHDPTALSMGLDSIKFRIKQHMKIVATDNVVISNAGILEKILERIDSALMETKEYERSEEIYLRRQRRQPLRRPSHRQHISADLDLNQQVDIRGGTVTQGADNGLNEGSVGDNAVVVPVGSLNPGREMNSNRVLFGRVQKWPGKGRKWRQTRRRQ